MNELSVISENPWKVGDEVEMNEDALEHYGAHHAGDMYTIREIKDELLIFGERVISLYFWEVEKWR